MILWGALPLLSYTLDDMWAQMVKRDDGVLRLPVQSFELGGVLVDRADAFLASHAKSEAELRRIFTLKLANVREGEEPTRRRSLRSEFTDEQWPDGSPVEIFKSFGQYGKGGSGCDRSVVGPDARSCDRCGSMRCARHVECHRKLDRSN